MAHSKCNPGDNGPDGGWNSAYLGRYVSHRDAFNPATVEDKTQAAQILTAVRKRNNYLCAVLEEYIHEATKFGGSIPSYCETWTRSVIAEMAEKLDAVYEVSFVFAISIFYEIQRTKKLLKTIREITC